MTKFEELNSINVNEFTETKDTGSAKLTYLSWAKAWEVVKTKCPDATYNIHRFGDAKLPYVFDVNTGYMVSTDVTIEGITHEMWLPVMDGKNKAMKNVPYTYKTRNGENTVAAATMFDINTAIMRCLTKNLAMFGLGLYIYAGEDIPQGENTEAKITKVDSNHIATIKAQMERTGITEKSFCTQLRIGSLEEMTMADFRVAMAKFEATPDKVKKNGKQSKN